MGITPTQLNTGVDSGTRRAEPHDSSGESTECSNRVKRGDTTMAKVYVVSYHNGSRVMEVDAASPGEIASNLDISMSGVSVLVNDDDKAELSHTLRDGDYVTFQKSTVKSGK